MSKKVDMTKGTRFNNPYVHSDFEDLKNRVLVAFIKSDKKQPNDIDFISIKGMWYAVVRHNHGLLAVYRYVVQRDVLKRLRRYPKEIV